MGETKKPAVEIRGKFVPGLLFGGILFTGAGIGFYWLYFAADANPPALVIGLVITLFGFLFFSLLASAYASCFRVDESGIVKTGLFRGVTRIGWDELSKASEEPGIEHPLLVLKLESTRKKRIVVYSNWLDDYRGFFDLISRYVDVDTSASRVSQREEAPVLDRSAEDHSARATGSATARSSGGNVRLRVTGTQIFYFLSTLLVAGLMIWRALNG
jgi:hypothetical protein